MTRITIAPLERAHLDAAAGLLAARQRRLRAHNPLLAPAFESPAAWGSALDEGLIETGAYGAAALDGRGLAGFMIMSPLVFGPADMTAAFFAPRPAQIGFGAHAAREGLAFDVYRELYAHVSERFVDRGYFDHVAYVSPDDAEVNEAFVSLGFGRAVTEGIRGVDPVADAVPLASIEIHQASAEDVREIVRLNNELLDHHTAAPIYWPHLSETSPAIEGFQRHLLEDAANAHFVAYQDGRAIGMNTFMPPDWVSPPLRPEKTIYLYQGIVSSEARSGGIGRAILAAGIDWAREQGYQHIALHFASANISGAKFWQSNGFHPVEHRLTRAVDPRIAWQRHRVPSPWPPVPNP